MCQRVIWIFAFMYGAAIVLLLLSVWGLLGVERDPLAGVFLIPLGLPWNRLLDRFPESVRPALAAAAPAVNLLILVVLCRSRR